MGVTKGRGLVTWISCPICKKELAGTDNWMKIPSFPKGNGLDEHVKQKHKQ